MKSVIVSAGMVSIPKALIESEWPRIKQELTFRVSDGAEFGGGEKTMIDVPCYYERDGHVEVPRYYFNPVSWQARSIAAGLGAPSFQNHTVVGEPINVKFRGKLWKKPDQESASSALQKTKAGVLSVRPAFGKTTITIHAATKVKRRTLIVVPTTMLLDQWTERICQFTNLRKPDVGIVQGPRCEWNKPFIVGTVQSLAEHSYSDSLFNSVGIFVADESHRMSAPFFVQAITRFPASVRWGLSATVERRDGLHKIFEYHIGPVVYEDLVPDLKATVYPIKTGVSLPERAYKNPWNQQVNMARLFNALAKSRERNEILCREIMECYKAGRKQLVLSMRLEQMTNLCDMLCWLYVPLKDIGIITGAKNDPKERQKILAEKRIIFATERIAGLGLDQPDLDTLVYALPSQNVEQNTGRITREHETKKKPLVIDLVDSIPMLQRMFHNRVKIYERLGYEVKNA